MTASAAPIGTSTSDGPGPGSQPPPPTDEAGAQVNRAARGTALNLAGAVIGAVVSFTTVGLITNVYGKAGAGLFFAATAAFTLGANAARLGAESSLTYFVSRLRANGQNRRIPTITRQALLATGSVATGLGGIGFVAAPVIAAAMTEGTASAQTATTMVRILAIAVPTFSLSQGMFGASRGFATMRPAVLTGQILRPLAQLVLVATVIVVTDELWPLAVAWGLSSLMTMVAIGTWLRRRIALVAARHPIAADPAAAPAESYWRFTGPRAIADLLSASLERLDVLLVAVIVGEIGAGTYGASNRLILAGQLMMIATAQSMAPLLSANFSQGRLDEAKRVLQTISGWNVILLWPVFIGLAFGAAPALSIFGDGFADGSSLVVVLSLGFLVIVGLGLGDTMLTMTGDTVASLVNHAVALVVMIGLSVALLPTVGLIGAAIAWAASRIILRVLAVARVWHTKGVHAIGTPLLTAIVVTTTACVPTGIAARIAFGQTFTAVAVHAGSAAAIQLLLVLRCRERLALDQLMAVVARR